MRVNRTSTALAVLTVVITVPLVFNSLHIRTQGWIVEFLTIGDWPFEWAIRKHYNEQRSELDHVRAFLTDNPEVARVFPAEISDTGLCVVLVGSDKICDSYDNPILADKMKRAFLIEARQYRGEVFLELGFETRRRGEFVGGYAYVKEGYSAYEICSSVEERTTPVACYFPLDEGWAIFYEWWPAE